MSRNTLASYCIGGFLLVCGISCGNSTTSPKAAPSLANSKFHGMDEQGSEKNTRVPTSGESAQSPPEDASAQAPPSDATPSLVEVESPPEAKETERKPIYDTSADAGAVIADALRAAQQDNRRVLLMFGGNWCGWCYKLHDLFEKDREIATLVRNEYILVTVDIGRMDKNMDLVNGYGAELTKHGVPFLTV